MTESSFYKLRLSLYIDAHKKVTNFCTRYNVFCLQNIFGELVKHKKTVDNKCRLCRCNNGTYFVNDNSFLFPKHIFELVNANSTVK